MNYEEQFMSWLQSLSVVVEDRRPGALHPLPNRGFAGYSHHDFLTQTKGICVHHSAAPASEQAVDAHARMHLSRWESAGGLAYTIAILPSGKVILAWPFDRRCYSQGWGDVTDKPESLGDENVKWKGVLVDGFFASRDYPDAPNIPTSAQLHALEAVRAYFWSIGKTEVTGHFEHGKPACPGDILQRWVLAHQGGSPALIEAPSSWYDFRKIEDRQRALTVLKRYTGAIDGKWGTVSDAALRSFQQNARLVVDGKWGPQTEAALLRALKVPL